MSKRGVAVLLGLAVVMALVTASCAATLGSRETPNGCAGGVSDPAGPTYRNVAYGPDWLHRADIHPACTETAVGTIIHVHAGGYTEGDRSEGSWPWIRRLRDLGWVVVSIDYRLAPANPWPAQTDDVQRAIAWWRGGAAERYAAPIGPIVGTGWSAGGHIAEFTALQDTGPKFDAVVTVGGTTHWPTRRPSSSETAIFGLNPATWWLEAGSTNTQVDPSDPPMMHIHSENDPYISVDQAYRLATAISDDGDPSTHVVEIDPDCGHSLECMTPERVDPFLASIAGG